MSSVKQDVIDIVNGRQPRGPVSLVELKADEFVAQLPTGLTITQAQALAKNGMTASYTAGPDPGSHEDRVRRRAESNVGDFVGTLHVDMNGLHVTPPDSVQKWDSSFSKAAGFTAGGEIGRAEDDTRETFYSDAKATITPHPMLLPQPIPQPDGDTVEPVEIRTKPYIRFKMIGKNFLKPRDPNQYLYSGLYPRITR